jgi:Xaa-Pro aminopeptidase
MIRRAVAVSAEGHRRMMRACRPGKYEYQLQAEFESTVTSLGAEYVAYPCIVGSGENSVILHYQSNRKMLEKGELVVADCASEYHNYASDITRTFPVGGKFTEPQKEIYSIVLRAQKAAIAAMKPGVAYSPAIERIAQEVIRDGLMTLGIVRDSLAYRKFFMHGLGHPVGLDTHDIYGDRILREGEVWTVEPGIYIQAEADGVDPKYWNIGVRIEDDVLVTAGGHEVLSDGVPKEIPDVERAMRATDR